MDSSSPSHDRLGRPQLTSKAEIERVALDQFVERGFAATTVDDIARAAGIARRTFFRYFASKNDVVWGDFDSLLGGLSGWLTDAPAATPTWVAIRDAIASSAVAGASKMSMSAVVTSVRVMSTPRTSDGFMPAGSVDRWRRARCPRAR
jgi:AcrR family transcriptional regulator